MAGIICDLVQLAERVSGKDVEGANELDNVSEGAMFMVMKSLLFDKQCPFPKDLLRTSDRIGIMQWSIQLMNSKSASNLVKHVAASLYGCLEAFNDCSEEDEEELFVLFGRLLNEHNWV